MRRKGKVILTDTQMGRTIDRLCYQLIEQHGDFNNTCIIGIQHKGVLVAERIVKRLREIGNIAYLEFGKLDITFFRDDFKFKDKLHQAYPTEMEFLIENKKVVLVDDVLYTGRTIQAAMNALIHFGRASRIELLVLVNRRFNRQLPIKPDYVGLTVDALDEAYVKVEWGEEAGKDRVLFYDIDRSSKR